MTTAAHPEPWNPLDEWKEADIRWVRVKISQEDLRRFTERSNWKGLAQSLGFLALVATTGATAYYAFLHQHWVFLFFALLLHGTFYSRFGDALHELGHNTVFSSRWLNVGMTALYGWLFWPWNPHLYRLSHQGYHHPYTLHQGTDGEDAPNYVEFTPRFVLDLIFHIVSPVAFLRNAARLLTLKPTSYIWRGRGYALDTWEQFVLKNATEKERQAVRRASVAALVGHVAFVAASLYFGLWLLPVLVTLAPFYGSPIPRFIAGAHQHAACDANNPDFRISCGDAILDPFSSFLYWHMEYHIEHHMFAAIPCYNLKKFSQFVADQLPPKEYALPRLLKLHRLSRQKYGTWQSWRDNFGRFKGF